VTRGLLVSGFIYNFLGTGSASLSLRNFLGALSVRIICRPRGVEGAAIEPDLRGRTVDRNRIK